MSVHDNIETIHAMAEVMKQIKSVEIPAIEIPIKKEGRVTVHEEVIFEDSTIDTIDIDGADEWWSAWCEIRELLNNAFDVDVGESGKSATLGGTDLYGTMHIETDHINFSVDIYSTDEKHFIAEYTPAEWSVGGMLFEGFDQELDEIELGRALAGAEQEILAHTTESAAETIDYWHTELAPQSYLTKQSRWANVRGVGRQTVSDRVRSANDKLDN